MSPFTQIRNSLRDPLREVVVGVIVEEVSKGGDESDDTDNGVYLLDCAFPLTLLGRG